MGLFSHTVKGAGKDSIDSRSAGKNKVAKFDKQMARNAGSARGLAERGRTDRNRKP